MIGIVLILVEGASKIIGSLGKPCAPEDRLTTGKGTTVLEMIRAFARASGRSIPIKLLAGAPAILHSAMPTPKKPT